MKHPLSKIEKHFFRVCIAGGLVMIAFGIVSFFSRIRIAGKVFSYGSGLPYTNLAPGTRILTWWGEVFLGFFCILFGIWMRYLMKKENEKLNKD